MTGDGLLGYLKLTDLPAGSEDRRRLLDVAVTAVNDFPSIAESSTAPPATGSTRGPLRGGVRLG